MREALLLVLLVAVNAAPVAARLVFGRRFGARIDGGLTLPDGRPLFGQSKTLLGVLAAIGGGTLLAPLLGFDWTTGLLIGGLAMLGDLATSFVKRRLGLRSSAPLPIIDQAAESLLPLVACKTLLALSWIQVLGLAAGFVVADLLISQLAFRLGIGQHPY